MRLDRVIAVRNDKILFYDNDECIKVFHSVYDKSDILKEAHNHACMEDAGLPVPIFREVCKIDGKWSIVSDFIKGKNLEILLQEKPDDYKNFIEMMVSLQSDMFEKECPPLISLKERLERRIQKADLDEIQRFSLHSLLNEMPTQRRICHGDFVPSNIVVSRENKIYLLDFSHVSSGNAEADIANTYISFLCEGAQEYADYYLERICHKTGIASQSVLQWIPIVAAAASTDARNEKKAKFLAMVK